MKTLIYKYKKLNSVYSLLLITENIMITTCVLWDRGSTVVKVLRYKSEGRWFDPSWCHWIFH